MAKIIKSKTDKSVAKKPIEKKILNKVEGKPVETKKEAVFAVAKYHNKNIMISPRKLRLLATSIKKLSPTEALLRLKFTNTKAARVLVKSIQNVIADAKNNFNLDENTLKFDTIQVDEGLKIKRMDKSHGARFARGLIMKRHSRLQIHVKGMQK